MTMTNEEIMELLLKGIGRAYEPRSRKKSDELGKLRKFREQQPIGWDFKTWEVKNGCVVQFGQMRIYYGRCCDCRTLVTKRRSIETCTTSGLTSGARWPDRCEACREAKAKAHNAGAKDRMQKLRAERRAFRDAQYKKLGIKPRTRLSVS